jgi:hypothetical protein
MGFCSVGVQGVDVHGVDMHGGDVQGVDVHGVDVPAWAGLLAVKKILFDAQSRKNTKCLLYMFAASFCD